MRPRPPPGRGNRPGPHLCPTREGLPSFPRPRTDGPSVRARPRSRPGSASGARSVWPLPPCCCGCEKAAAAAEEQPDEKLQRLRRCPPPALAGSLVGWRRRPCRGGPHHVLPPGKNALPPLPPGVRRGWRRGRTRPRRSGCHPVRRRRPAGGWGQRVWPRGGVSWVAAAAARGRRGEWERSGRARLGPSARGRRGPGPGRPSRTWQGRAHGARGVKCCLCSVRTSACGPREVSVPPSFPTRSVGVHCGERPEVGGRESPRGERCGPGTCGKEEWPTDCAAGHPPDLVVLW